jgi:probable phosphoglycerate mutase
MMRHGQTDWNKKHLYQGRTDIPLNENGRYVAQLTREGMKNIPFDVAFCSPLCRAKETAEIVLSGRNVPLYEDERIIEMSFGPYEATDMRIMDERMKIFFEHPDQYDVPEGAESFEEVLEREGDFLKELIGKQEYKDSTILIATHGAALRGLICAMKESGVARFWEGGVHKNCGVTIVDVIDGKYHIIEEATILYDEKDLK